MVTNSPTALNRKRVVECAAAHRLPAIFEFDWIVRDGGLMVHAPNLDETFARVRSGRLLDERQCCILVRDQDMTKPCADGGANDGDLL